MILAKIKSVFRRLAPEWGDLRQGKWEYAAAALSGLLLRLAFPKPDLWFFAWFAMIPLFWALRNKTGKAAFYRGWTFGFVYLYAICFFLHTLYVFVEIVALGIVILAAISAIYVGVFALGAAAVQKKTPAWAILFVPAWWVALESIRVSGELGYPFGSLSHTQWQNTSLIQIVSITGTGALSFMIILFNYTLARALFGMGYQKKQWRWVEVAVVAGAILILRNLVAPMASHARAADAGSKDKVGVLMIQQNVPQIRRWNSYQMMESSRADAVKMWDEDAIAVIKQTDQALARYSVNAVTTGSLPAHKEDIRLIIWPETAIPDYFFNLHRRYINLIEEKIGEWKIPVVLGSSRVVEGPDKSIKESYNSAYYFKADATQSIQYYDKRHLVPCGEDFSYLRYIPFIQMFGLDLGSFDRGKVSTVFDLPREIAEDKIKNTRFSIVICFESSMPYLFRESVRNGAQFMIIVTNDGWYGTSSGAWQHEIMSVFRAIETRRWICRCANTGISCFISPAGEILQSTRLNETTDILRSIQPRDEITFYVKHGPWFSWLCLLISLVAFAYCLVRR